MSAWPLVSVVMINYNRERFVGEAIASVRAQGFNDWELIVVENGSEDRSAEVIERHTKGDPRARIVRLPRRMAIPAAANLGIKEARGTYIARLDSDDVWLSNRLEVQLEWMELAANERVGVCGAQCELIDAEGNPIGHKWFPINHTACLAACGYRNPFCQSAVLIRQECFTRFGRYDESFAVGEDLELWMRLAQAFDLYNLPDVLVRQRLWGTSACMRHYRATVDATLRARRLASRRYGRRLGAAGHVALALTWCMRWCPPAFARWLFYNGVLEWERRFVTQSGGHARPVLSPHLEGAPMPGKMV